MKKTFRYLFIVSSLFLFTGCSKDDGPGSRKVEYKVTAVRAAILRVVYTGADGTDKSVGSQPLLTWTSGELIIPNSVSSLKIYAEGEDNNIGTSSLNVQIYVDGVLKAETTDTDDVNQIFEAEASH